MKPETCEPELEVNLTDVGLTVSNCGTDKSMKAISFLVKNLILPPSYVEWRILTSFKPDGFTSNEKSPVSVTVAQWVTNSPGNKWELGSNSNGIFIALNLHL